MPGVQGEAFRRMDRHELLTAEFEAAGVDPRRFGFYNQPAFLARESANPDYLTRYAEWVATRPISSDYEAHVRATVPKLARLLATAFAACNAQGRCVAAYTLMTQMLDRLQVWSFGVFGSVVLDAAELGLRRTIHTIAFKRGPRGIDGHFWVCAPPYLIVDFSLALQRWDAAIAPLIPDVVLADARTPRVHARAEDCVSDGVRALFAQAEGWHDPDLHHRLDPRLRGFHRTIPAREVTARSLRVRFVPIVIQQPDETLAQVELDGAGHTGDAIWNEIVGPAFGMPPLPYEP